MGIAQLLQVQAHSLRVKNRVEGNTMAAEKPQSRKRREVVARVGNVKVERQPNGQYYMKVYDVTRGYVRKTAGTSNLEIARKAAKVWNAQLKEDQRKALISSRDRLTIESGLKEGIRLGGRRNHKRSEDHGENLEAYRTYFMDWVRGKARYWDQVDSRLVVQYIESLAARERKPRTIRNYVAILPMAAKYWAGVDSKLYQPLTVSHPALALGEVKKNFLTLDQLFKAIQVAQETGNDYGCIGLIVGGLAGLRIREMVDIHKEDFDPESGVLWVRHAKTKHSPRLIPLIPYVAACLKAHFEAHPDKTLVTQENGNPGKEYTLSKPMRRAIADAGLIIAPKDAARKTFMNWARQPGIDKEALDEYAGHAPRAIAEKFYRVRLSVEHYRAFVTDRLKEVHAVAFTKYEAEKAAIVDIQPAAIRSGLMKQETCSVTSLPAL